MATTRILLLTFLLVVGFAAIAPGQGGWAPGHDQPGFGIAGRVFALGTFRNELIAGTYRKPWRDGNTLNHIARFDGVRWLPLGSGLSAPPRAALEFQGDLYVAGEFLAAGGVPVDRIARWNGSQWFPVGAGFDARVWALCEHQGQLYATGEFTNSGSQPVHGVARWNGSQWLPVGAGLGSAIGLEPAGRALVSVGNDLYVGGFFDLAGGVVVNHVARWDGTTWSALGGGVVGGAVVFALAWYQQQLFVGGYFGQAGSVPVDHIAAWNGSQWSPVGHGVQNPFYTPQVDSLRVWNGDLYVGGTFTHSGSIATSHIARFDGTTLQPIGGVGAAELNPPSVLAMTVWNDRLYCGGEFQLAGPPGVGGLTRAVFHIAAYDGSAWAPVGEGLGFGNEVHVLTRFQGDVVAGGRFVSAGDHWANTLARFDGTSWRPFGVLDGTVRGAIEHNGDLWVVGEFDTVDGVPADGVARYDGTNWHTLGGSLTPNHYVYAVAAFQGDVYVGTVGGIRRWTGSGWQAIPISGTITALHEHLGQLYVGGTALGAAFGAPNLHTWNGITLTAIDPGFDGGVASLGTFGGDLLVGGYFTQAGALPARSIARWDGSSWSTLGNGTGTTLPPGNVAVTEITSYLGQLVVGGSFRRQTGAAGDHLMRWNGTAWIPFAAEETNGAVFALLPDDLRGELHVGGWFFRIGNRDSSYYGRWQQAPIWTVSGQPLGSARRTPALVGDGSLLPGSQMRWRLSSAREATLAVFVTGLSRIDAPVFGGVVVPDLDILTLMPTDAIGAATLSVPWIGLPTGLEVWTQAGVIDPDGPQGWTFSNTVRLQTP